jgi:hypothetical protein
LPSHHGRYQDYNFDYEFISALRTFLLHCVSQLNQGKGATLAEIRTKTIQAKVSKIELNVSQIQQVLRTLVYDYVIDEDEAPDGSGEFIYLPAKRVTTMCDFPYWSSDILSPDFHFRNIVFDDGVVLSAHEPHYQT